MSKFTDGTEVRVGFQNHVPLRYQGRTGFIAGTAVNSRGTQQYLVSFGTRRATPLPLSRRDFRVV